MLIREGGTGLSGALLGEGVGRELVPGWIGTCRSRGSVLGLADCTGVQIFVRGGSNFLWRLWSAGRSVPGAV